ncbi:MAG TPA: vitamin B12 dependent-methionine synthase activation domain-containing protein, partial [Candidatus Binataceae bacterium]|nr:vitamin B12 dependent-methionine synthase activation domain-containing protein [Candidatus Binataceae bacterium]
GKNLVDIILSNNGYKVINLGIKIPPDELIKACAKYQPDAIGLSGLLVKSAQMMVITAQDLKTAGVRCPILVGGAALSARFTRIKIAPEYDGLVAYANDAMAGLDLANQVMDPQRREALIGTLDEQTRKLLAAVRPVDGKARTVRHGPAVVYDGPIPEPPDLKLHLVRDFDLEQIFRYINPVMLYARHLGFKNFEQAFAAGDPKALELQAAIAAVEDEILARPDITARAAYRFFAAHSDGDRVLTVYAPDGKHPLERFIFGRQSETPGLCLADYVTPAASGRPDYLAMMVTTIGEGVRALAEEWKDQGEYLRSHILQILALEGAEAFAELLHLKLRQMWGIGDPPGLTMKDLYQGHYHGKRFSFGYPACPRLEDQTQLFRALELEQSGLGVRLTEGYMMDPESSVSAIVFHNPLAKYFTLSPADIEALEREHDSPTPQAAVS